RLHVEPHPFDVHRHQPIEDLLRVVDERADVAPDAGVVEQEVDGAESTHGFRRVPLTGGGAGRARAPRPSAAAAPLYGPHALPRRAVRGPHPPPPAARRAGRQGGRAPPSRAKRITVARLMPPAAPVMIATLPAKRPSLAPPPAAGSAIAASSSDICSRCPEPPI